MYKLFIINDNVFTSLKGRESLFRRERESEIYRLHLSSEAPWEGKSRERLYRVTGLREETRDGDKKKRREKKIKSPS